jgi:hypothetical protein
MPNIGRTTVNSGCDTKHRTTPNTFAAHKHAGQAASYNGTHKKAIIPYLETQ